MNSTIPPKVILFDWDGTLADTRPLKIKIMNELSAFYHQTSWLEIKNKHQDKTLSFKDNFRYFFGDHANEAYEMYVEKYLKRYKNDLKEMPGALDLLQKLSSTDISLIIISNAEKSLLLKGKELLFPNIHFKKIIGYGDAAFNKPHTAPVLLALQGSTIEINHKNIWFVGDSSQDIECACNAGCQPILVGKSSSTISDKYIHEKQQCMPALHYFENLRELMRYYLRTK